MFGSEVLDVVIGVVFVYLTLSLICSAIQEAIASFLRLRARFLYAGIRNLLSDPNGEGLVRDLFNHPLIDSLFPGEYRPGSHHNLPSYIPPRAFALAIMDIAAPQAPGLPSGAAGATAAGQAAFPGSALPNISPLRDNLVRSSVVPPPVGKALLTLTDAASGDAATVRQNIEQWYSNAMDRVSSAYKRRIHAIILVLGCVVAAAVNADSINIVSALSTNKAVRDSLIASVTQNAARTASDVNTQGAAASTPQDPRVLVQQIRDTGLPVGWVMNSAPGDFRSVPLSPWLWVQKLIGILLTVAAISMGAPFWFDLLNKVTVVRSAIKPSTESELQARSSAAGAA